MVSITFLFLLSDIGQLSMDWKARNIYWSDIGFSWIAMKPLAASFGTTNSLDSTFRVVVDKYLEKPTGVAAHPLKL